MRRRWLAVAAATKEEGGNGGSSVGFKTCARQLKQQLSDASTAASDNASMLNGVASTASTDVWDGLAVGGDGSAGTPTGLFG